MSPCVNSKNKLDDYATYEYINEIRAFFCVSKIVNVTWIYYDNLGKRSALLSP